MKLSSRIEREKRTVGIMIKMYCDHNHAKVRISIVQIINTCLWVCLTL